MLAALLLAAGASTRAGEDKAFAGLGGIPVALWSALRLAAEPRVGLLVVAARRADGSTVETFRPVTRVEVRVVRGGERRSDSARAALEAASDADQVLVHDAARPFLDVATLARVLAALDTYGAAAAALPVADTVRRGTDDWAGETVERAGLYAMQTPQAFARGALVDAYARVDDATDCAAAVLASGGRVRLVAGDRLNFKVTTAEDLALARRLVERGLVCPP